MGKFIVEITRGHGPIDPKLVDAESRIEAEISVLKFEPHGMLITRIRAFPARQDEKGAWVKDEATCGNCGWLHENSPQFTSGLYDRDKGQPWCWAVPSHVHRHPRLPACAHWKPKEE